MERAAMHQMMRSSRDGEARPVSRETMRRIFAFAKPYRGRLAAFLAVSLLSALLSVLTPVLAGRVVDQMVLGGDRGVIVLIASVIAVVALVDAGVGLLGRWLSAAIGEDVILDLRTRVYDHVQRMPVAFFMRTRTGALVSRLNADVLGAQRAFATTLSGVVTNAVTVLLTLGVMVSKSWLVAVLTLVLLPVFLLPSRRIGGRLAGLRREASDHNAAMTTQMTERFSAPGATLVKLFGSPRAESREFEARARRVRDIGVKSSLMQQVFLTLLTLVSALALALVYGVGGWFAVDGTLNPGDVVVLALLLTRLYGPLTQLSNARADLMGAAVSFERVFEILDLAPLIRERDDARPLPPAPLGLAFKDVRFAYPSAQDVSLASLESVAVLDTRGGEEVIHGVDFEVRPGQTVALVGSSGAGKSTIAQLAARLYDVTSGSVRLGGVDVRDLTFEALREGIGMVTQDGHLFHESIRANIALSKPDASDGELWAALRGARLEDLVRSLPDGLDTIVGERGYRLSGGERQRMTIARVLLSRPGVVILDEATAALDSTNEAAVQAALGEALEGRTALVIAHRLSTVRTADEILVIEGGRIAERGTHAELMARGGRYEELYRTQFAE
ncbi:ABC transporter ATP-binding protein [Arthrobacter sp. UM1]|nr:ABC transporter ATP-binding protein [Arthrobacter sp. UM1]MCB4207848.1 ABC transporter ATP-binding protein [Arthrobacter sp. UM1]